MGPFDRLADRLASASTTSTASWPAKPRNGSRGCSRTSTPIEPPHDEKYHLTEDLADKALDLAAQASRLCARQAVPDVLGARRRARPAPHLQGMGGQIQGQVRRRLGCLRERIFKRQKELGWIPADTKLTPRADTMAAWDSIPESERPFQRRLMEVFAGFVEHVDAQVGRLIDELDHLGMRDNTHHLLYLRRQRLERRRPERHASASCWRRTRSRTRSSSSSRRSTRSAASMRSAAPKTDNMYHAGWAWAGDTPFQHTKLVASHFGGTRNPLVISWPKRIKPDKTPRRSSTTSTTSCRRSTNPRHQAARRSSTASKQDPIDGVSMAYTFADAEGAGAASTPSTSTTTAAAASITTAGIASTFGPFIPWTRRSVPGSHTWDANKDVWELYDLATDFSQADDLAAQEPEAARGDEGSCS